jgi:hypothetical protein
MRSFQSRARTYRIVPLAVCLAGAMYAHLVRAPARARAADILAVDVESEYEHRFLKVRESVHSSDTILLLLRANSPLSVVWTPYLLNDPPTWLVASQTEAEIAVVRTGQRSFEIYPESGPLVPCGPRDVLNTRGIATASTVQIPGVLITVLETSGERCPSRVRFQFDKDLDDPTIVWMAESYRGFQNVVPPAVGIGVRLGR